jgi:hypothetical protein
MQFIPMALFLPYDFSVVGGFRNVVGGVAAVAHDTMKLLSRPSKFLSFFIMSCYPPYGVTGMPLWRIFTPMVRLFLTFDFI